MCLLFMLDHWGPLSLTFIRTLKAILKSYWNLISFIVGPEPQGHTTFLRESSSDSITVCCLRSKWITSLPRKGTKQGKKGWKEQRRYTMGTAVRLDKQCLNAYDVSHLTHLTSLGVNEFRNKLLYRYHQESFKTTKQERTAAEKKKGSGI